MFTKKCDIQIKILFLFCPAFLIAQFQRNDFQLNGNVESVQTKCIVWKNESQTSVSGFFETENFDSVYLKFDRKGNLILRKKFLDYQGKLGLFDETQFQFNSANQIEFQETRLIQNGEEPKKISQRKIYYYIESQMLRMDEFNFGRTENQYWVTNFIYDGGRLKKKEFWMEDKVFSTTVFENRLMKVISEKNYHNDGKLGKTIENHYDDNYTKLLLKYTVLGNQKTEESFEYKNGNLKNWTIKENGKLIYKENLLPNGLPNEVQKLNYQIGNFDEFQFKYEFDSSHNWINCVILINQTPQLKIIRQIKYYAQT